MRYGLENYACALEKATQEAQSQIDNGAETMEELRKKVTQFGTLLEVYRLLFEQLQNQRIHSLVLAEMLHHSRESEEFLKFLAEFGFGELSGYLTESQFLESGLDFSLVLEDGLQFETLVELKEDDQGKDRKKRQGPTIKISKTRVLELRKAYYCSLHRGEMSGYFFTVIPTPE